MKCIGISGTPGTGKTAVARVLSEKLRIPFIDLSTFVMEHKLYLYYDDVRNSYVIDEERVSNTITSMYREMGAMIIAGHYIEILPREIFEVVFVLRRSPYELIEILKQRGWQDQKIAENVESELLSICTLNAIEELGEDLVIEIDVTARDLNDAVNEMIEIIQGFRHVRRGHRIDWLVLLSEDELVHVLKYIERNRQY